MFRCFIKEFWREYFKKKRRYKLVFIVSTQQPFLGGKMQLIPIDQQLALQISEQDAKGNQETSLVPFDVPPTWALVDASLGSVVVADDGMSASVVPSGALGQSQVQLTGVIGGKTYQGSLDVQMVPGAVAAISIQPGALSPQ